MDSKCFCHFNGYEVKDAKARRSISDEITSRENADNELRLLIENETTARTNADNDLLTIIDNMGSVIESHSKCLTPQMFGAKGDGETDDTEAINATITAHNENSLPIYFPDGRYVVNGALLPINRAGHIFGTGEIEANGADNETLFTFLHRVVIEGISIYAEGYESVIKIHDTQCAKIHRCIIDSDTSIGVHIDNALLCSVTDSYIINCPKCIYITSENGDTGDNYFHGNTFNVVGGTGKSVLYFEGGGGIRFYDNKVLNYEYGVNIRSNADTSVLIIEGNSMEHGVSALYVNNRDSYGRIIFANNQLANMHVTIENNCYEVIIANNLFTGIREENSAAFIINTSDGNVSFQNNIIKEYRYSVLCYSHVDNLVINGNNFNDYCTRATLNSKAIYHETFDKTITSTNAGFTLATIHPNTNSSCIVEVTLGGATNEYFLGRIINTNGEVTLERIFGNDNFGVYGNAQFGYLPAITGEIYCTTTVRGSITSVEY